MKIILDTNVLLVSISSKSKFRPIFEAFINEEYTLCVTTDVLFEYEEIIRKHMGSEFSEYVLQLIENANNVEWITNYYKWNLIRSDADDNKFTDCYLNSNGNYLITNDKHFNILNRTEFPKVNLLKAEEFLELIKKKK